MGTDLECGRCGYEWTYNGQKSQNATCPDCYSPVPLDGENRSTNGGSDGDSAEGGSKDTVRTEMWGEQTLDEFSESMMNFVVSEVENSDPDAELLGEVERMNQQIGELYEVVETLVHELGEDGSSVDWENPPNDHDPIESSGPYDPTEELEK